MTLIFVAILLSVLHTGIATYLLARNADKIANWNLSLLRAALGQFAVFLVALFFTAGFVEAIRVTSLLSTVEYFLAAPLLFLLLCGIGQDRMISYLSKYRGRRRFLQPWELRRVGLFTMLQMIFYYICVSLVALGAITYAEWTKQSAQIATTQKRSP